MSEDSGFYPPTPKPQITGAPQKRSWVQRFLALFTQPIKLPGWAALLFFAVTQIPDWKGRIEFWLGVAKMGGGFFAMIASVIASPYFTPSLVSAGLLWIAFVGEPDKGVHRYHWLKYVGWSVFSICFTAIILAVSYGAFQVLIHEQVNNIDLQLQHEYVAHPTYWHLTQFQKETFSRELKNTAEKDRFQIVIECEPDSSSRTYADDIGGAFYDAHWPVNVNCLSNNLKPDLVGLSIGLSKSLAAKMKGKMPAQAGNKHLEILAKILDEAKIPGVWSLFDDGTKNDNFYLVVGNPP